MYGLLSKENDLKILILSPNQISRYNWGHQLFRNEIGRQSEAFYWGNGYPDFDEKLTVSEVITKFCPWVPDVILTYGWRYSAGFEGLDKIKKIAKVHITVDYGRPVGIPRQNKFFKKNNYDLVFAITQNAERLLTKNKVCDLIKIIPFSADTNIYKPLSIKGFNKQILASFTARKDIYPNRSKIQNVAKTMGVPVITKRVVHQQLIRAINNSQITLTSNNIFKSLSMRYTETLACGGFLMADRPEDLSMVGLKDGKHLVIYKNIGDLRNKIEYYLNPKNLPERNKIAKQGMKFVRKNHSCKKRVEEMLGIIQKELNI